MGEAPRPDIFGDVAVELGLITPVQLGQALDAQQATLNGQLKPLPQVLIDSGLLTPEQVAQVVREKQHRSVTGERRIGPFEIIEKIGAGGMGAVYRARDVRKSRHIALKILPPALAKDAGYLDRFITEAKLAATLDHDNIVKGYGSGEFGGLHYFAMEYVDGENVQEMLAQVEKFPEDTALQIVLPIARALQHAHYHGLLHQDIKPENIIIDRRGIAKLLDLGLARRSGDMAKVRLGTPLYASPEQVQGDRPLDIRSDIYSLGATLYHMLTGRPPYVGRDDKDTMAKHLEEELAWPQDSVPELSDNVCQVVSRMLVKDPSYRYQNPKEVIHDYEALLDDRSPTYAMGEPTKERREGFRPPTTGKKRRKPTGTRRSAEKVQREPGAQPRQRRPARRQRGQSDQTDPATIWVVVAISVVVLLSILVIALAMGG